MKKKKLHLYHVQSIALVKCDTFRRRKEKPLGQWGEGFQLWGQKDLDTNSSS